MIGSTYGSFQSVAHKAALPYFKSNLPIIIIDVPTLPMTTTNQNGTLKIVTGRSIKGRYDFETNIKIKTRGSSSNIEYATKKQYAISPMLPDYSSDTAKSILGMPSNKDWILQANFYDRSQLRNDFNSNLWRLMGHYATRTVPCEVIINGVYWGTHSFMEKVGRDVNRVNIAATTNAAPNGGYIIKKDGTPDADEYRYTSSVNAKSDFIHVYPKVDPANLTPTAAIQAYIKGVTDQFETALAASNYDTTAGWELYADKAEFVDWVIFYELIKTLDGYVRSMYFSRDTNGKLKPLVWDIGDWTHGSGERTGSSAPTGWWFSSSTVFNDSPSWAARMMSGANFLAAVKTRWAVLRAGVFSNTNFFALLNSYATGLRSRGAIGRNFQKWPEWIISDFGVPGWRSVSGTWEGELTDLTAWLVLRLAWLDSQLA